MSYIIRKNSFFKIRKNDEECQGFKYPSYCPKMANSSFKSLKYILTGLFNNESESDRLFSGENEQKHSDRHRNLDKIIH